MSKRRVLPKTSVWDRAQVTAAFEANGIKPSHATRLYSKLVRNPEVPWNEVVDLPKAAVVLLEEKFCRFTSHVLNNKASEDGETTKLLIELQDGLQVEAVIMKYDTSDRYCAEGDQMSTSGHGHQRATLCVSSQVGCQMGCTFCATGTMGLKGNLTSGEIIEQLVHASRTTPIRNVVFMGMGEPLNNYEAVHAAVDFMTDPKYFGLGKRHVTVSTVGVIPKILKMPDDMPGVSLALSLHAPTQELRSLIVPTSRAYKLDRLMSAIDTYQQRTAQRVFVEYVVLAGVNDKEEHVHQLGQLLRGKDVVVNFIPWNPVYSPEGPQFAAPAVGRVQDMQRTLKEQYELHCTVRQEKGQDIAGACGQLVVEHSGKTCGGPSALKDIEEVIAA